MMQTEDSRVIDVRPATKGSRCAGCPDTAATMRLVLLAPSGRRTLDICPNPTHDAETVEQWLEMAVPVKPTARAVARRAYWASLIERPA